MPKELKARITLHRNGEKGFPLVQARKPWRRITASASKRRPGKAGNRFTFDLGSGVTEFAGRDACFPAFYYTNSKVPSVTMKVYKYPDAAAYINPGQEEEIPYWTSWMRNLYSETSAV